MARAADSPVNRRETGARTLKPKRIPDASDTVSKQAAKNRKPPFGLGNMEPLDDHNEKTRHYDGQSPPRGGEE